MVGGALQAESLELELLLPASSLWALGTSLPLWELQAFPTNQE